MSMNVNQDYSQFYRGTTNIPAYGSGANKKDTLVKYGFNTTDEHGNKVMDKMSKEETMKAVNDISSQYGDSVIVQFSGDGLAALAEGAKSMSGRAMTEEEAAKRAAKYLAENYLDESHAEDFMSAMETIAKYGLNGSVSDSGKVIYNVQEGQVWMSGAPGSHVDMEGWLKANDTKLYNQLNAAPAASGN